MFIIENVHTVYEVKKMLFATYWEINPELSLKDVAANMMKARKEGRWPPKNMEILGTYITPSMPMWGVTLSKAESEKELYKSLVELMRELPGLFIRYKVSPVQSIDDVIHLALESKPE